MKDHGRLEDVEPEGVRGGATSVEQAGHGQREGAAAGVDLRRGLHPRRDRPARRAAGTTHWNAADLFRTTYPRVDLDPALLYVDHGSLLTSAGAAAGLDLCLHMVGRDHGAAADPASLDHVLAWLDENSHCELTLDDVAARAGMSIRTLNQRFRDELDDTPFGWLTGTRVRRAQELLETSDIDVESVGRRVGLGSASNFRAVFVARVGVAPRAYRRAFRARP